MTQDEYARTLDELDRQLNDPDVPMDPAKVWSLLAVLSERDTGVMTRGGPSRGADASHAAAALGGGAIGGSAD